VGGDFRIKLILSFGVLNALLYSFFLAVIIFYSAQSPHHAAFGSCGLASAASRAALIAKIYRVTLSVIVCILGIAFLIYGSRVFSVLYTQKRTESNRVGMTKTVMVAVTFPVALMLQCALLLYGTFGKTINTAASLVLLLLVELTPIGLLVRTNHRRGARVAHSRRRGALHSHDTRRAFGKISCGASLIQTRAAAAQHLARKQVEPRSNRKLRN
jgi:tellurite resistance protein TehA-like permease